MSCDGWAEGCGCVCPIEAAAWQINDARPVPASRLVDRTPPPPLPQPAVYLLDDGRDVEKKKFIHSLGVENAVYVRWVGGELQLYTAERGQDTERT